MESQKWREMAYFGGFLSHFDSWFETEQ